MIEIYRNGDRRPGEPFEIWDLIIVRPGPVFDKNAVHPHSLYIKRGHLGNE